MCIPMDVSVQMAYIMYCDSRDIAGEQASTAVPMLDAEEIDISSECRLLLDAWNRLKQAVQNECAGEHVHPDVWSHLMGIWLSLSEVMCEVKAFIDREDICDIYDFRQTIQYAFDSLNSAFIPFSRWKQMLGLMHAFVLHLSKIEAKLNAIVAANPQMINTHRAYVHMSSTPMDIYRPNRYGGAHVN